MTNKSFISNHIIGFTQHNGTRNFALDMAVFTASQLLTGNQLVVYNSNINNLHNLRAKCVGSMSVPFILFGKHAKDLESFYNSDANVEAMARGFHAVYVFTKIMLNKTMHKYEHSYHMTMTNLMSRTTIGLLGWYRAQGNNFTFISGLINGAIMVIAR
jgi:hypothetical protein